MINDLAFKIDRAAKKPINIRWFLANHRKTFNVNVPKPLKCPRLQDNECVTRFVVLKHILDRHLQNFAVASELLFTRVATTQVDLLFIELMSHVPRVKQIKSQIIHLTL